MAQRYGRSSHARLLFTEFCVHIAPYGASPLRGKSTQQARLFDFE